MYFRTNSAFKEAILSNIDPDNGIRRVQAGGTYPNKCGIYVSDNAITTLDYSTMPVGYPVDDGMHPGSRGGTLMIYGGRNTAISSSTEYHYTHVLICDNGAWTFISHTTNLSSPPTRWYIYEGSFVNARVN